MGGGITIVGLGPGDPVLVTREAWSILESAEEAYGRTRFHGVWEHLPAHLRLHSFDSVYEKSEDFEDVYRTIVETLIDLAERPRGVIYLVPGDPTVGEATVLQLRRRASEIGLPFRIVHGVSFLEPALALAGLDALDGLQVADALELSTLHHPPFHPDHPVIVGQLDSRLAASDVKLTLMTQYPPDHAVVLIHDAGLPSALVERMPLHLLDQRETFGLHSCLVVPPLAEASSFERFQEIIAHLRAPEGCPWDRQQTHESLRPHLLEEAYEALETIDGDDPLGLREELGDLLLQIVLQAQIAAESGEFTMAQVIAGIMAKIIRRHPHVFGDLEVEGVDDVLHNWEGLKAAEREALGGQRGVLDGVPPALPALAQALEIQGRVARVGFDWREAEGPRQKVLEELDEVRTAVSDEARLSEIGDLLFAVVNYARKLGVDAESALRETNRRFRKRFARVEAAAVEAGRPLSEMTLEALDDLWEAAKGAE